MAKNRLINTKFWDDNYISELDPIEKLIYLYLLTNPLTTIAGVYEIKLRKIAFDTGIDKDMLSKILMRFEKDNKIIYKDDYIFVRNFIKYQTLNPSIKKGIAEVINNLPNDIKNIVINSLGTEWVQTVLFNLIKSNLIKSNHNPIESEKMTDGFLKKDQDQKPDPKPEEKKMNSGTSKIGDLEFNKFWKFYNRREGDEMKVRTVFKNLIRSDQDYKDLITATRNYNNLTADRELKYMKMPMNFLSCYRDFININN